MDITPHVRSSLPQYREMGREFTHAEKLLVKTRLSRLRISGLREKSARIRIGA